MMTDEQLAAVHAEIARVEAQVAEMERELREVAKKFLVSVVSAAFILGSWAAGLQSQAIAANREIERLDLQGSVWSRQMTSELDKRFADIQSTLARIEERLAQHMERVPK